MFLTAALPSNPSRILVRGTNWVGDTVMSLPAIKELRRIFPSSHFTVWAPAALVPLLKATGIPDSAVSFDDSAGGPFSRPFRMKGSLASGCFDIAILLQNAFESAFTAWIAGIRARVGYPTDLRGPLLSVKVPLTREIRQKHQVFYYLGITDYLTELYGVEPRLTGKSPDCSVRIAPQSLKTAEDLLSSERVNPDRLLFALCPGSVNSEAKRWPADNFAALADLLIDDMAAEVVFLGTRGEYALVENVRSLMRNKTSANLAGKIDMLEAMAVMNLSKAVISNDTGSAHLAVAASATVLTIFGPTTPGATAPFGDRSHIIQGEAPCAPCRHYRCPLPPQPCMRTVTPEDVLDGIRTIVEQ